MNKSFFIPFWAFVASLIVLMAISLAEPKISGKANDNPQSLDVKVERQIRDWEFSVVKLHEQWFTDTFQILRNWNEVKSIALESGFDCYIFRNDTLLQWTNQEISPIPTPKKLKAGSNYYKAANGHYFVFLKSYKDYDVLCATLIKKEYIYRNQFLQNHLHPSLSFLKEIQLSAEPKEGYSPLLSISGSPLFYIQIAAAHYIQPLWIWYGFIFFLIVLLVSAHQLMQVGLKRHSLLATIIFAAFWFIVRFLNTYYQEPTFIYKTSLFNPFIYASSAWFPSLGDLLIDSLIVIWWLIMYEKVYSIKFRTWNPHIKNILFVFWLVAALLMSHMSVLSLRSLTIDSQISFNISNIYHISQYTYIALLLLIIQLLSVYYVVRNFYRMWERYNFNRAKWMQVLMMLMLYVATVWLSESVTLFQLAFTILLMVVLLLYKHFNTNFNRFQQYFGLIFIIAFFAAWGINHWSEKKEHEERKIFALKIVAQNDITTDYFLRGIERKIEKDAYITEYFQSPFITKSLFEKRIRQIYFTGYLSKYEVSVYDYDRYGNHFKARNQYSYRTLNKVYEQESTPYFNKYFRYLGSNTLAKGYIARIEIEDSQGDELGVMFILLKPKLIQNENRFDELLIDGYKAGIQPPNSYSFALYKDKNLVYQSGNYPFRIKNTWGESVDNFHFFEENGYEHMLYTDKQPLTVVVSKEINTVTQTAGLFSFIFTLCTSILVLILFVYVTLNAQAYKRFPWFQRYCINPLRNLFNELLLIQTQDALYLRTRIQTSIIFILFVSLLVSAYLTIGFINQKYNTRQTERLMKKLRSATLAVENENIRTYELKYANEVEAFVNELADLYDNDITLFDVNGKVLASSISKIYDEHIIAPVMNEDAYYHLKLLRESQYSNFEQIGTLSFQSAYAPVFYSNNELLGYLHLPYFSQRVDLLSEISSIIIGFINLYVVLFIFIGLLAYIISRNISRPLALIQQSLARIKLEQNEPIAWSRQDEIGELVAQYNRMIAQLEESARKLAETEREDAWREIARQIAHEIKNPLTPMKLSIQHLHRAYMNNDANIGEKLQKTTQLLVNQIDMLSDLASEFSSFAKMPQPMHEWFNVCDALANIKRLYQTDTNATIHLQCDVQDELYFDASYFSRSIGNIVKNALQSIPEDREGFVEIRAKQYTDFVEISVRDNGIGMSEAQASNVFKPYFSTKIHGMGLGLPIVKSMIESGKGTITFTSTEGQGTVFVIQLPLTNR